jgi:phospholipid-translocating ATPase
MSNNRESGSSISKLNLSSRSPTPTPCELRPIYEAESPDELALVDAAFAYNCKLLKRSPGHAVVSLPGEGLVEFEVICEKGFSFPFCFRDF